MGNPAERLDEEAIIRRVRDGDVNAFSALVIKYQDNVARIAARHVPRDQVPDVSQDVFVKACRGLAGYNGAAPFEHWLARIAVRTCHDFWRRRVNRAETPISDIAEDAQAWLDAHMSRDENALHDREVEKREATAFLHAGMSRLSAKDRTILTLTYLKEYTVAETAEMLGMSVANVKVRAFRSRRKLRKILAAAMEGAS